MYEQLQSIVIEIQSKSISSDRKTVLEPLIDFVRSKHTSGRTCLLNFICTHNSRRSQFSQIWAQTAADHFGIDVVCFSGGVEVTAFNERAVASIQRMGFKVISRGEENPTYLVKHSESGRMITAFSKLHDDPVNPLSDFAAVMTCSHADENCPYIPGADARISITYEDPKAFDGTDLEADKYDERSLQIGAEMFYVFSHIKERI